jgi:hypothetical protein
MAAVETRNLKMVTASQAVAPGAGKTIGKIGFGESGELPTPDDAALINPFIKNVLEAKVNSDGSLTFTYSLDYNEANGRIIREIGLYCNDGETLVAREVRDTIVKDMDTAISGSITILLGGQ